MRKVSVIGLGYVGFPVAVAFSRFGQVIGFDINETRLKELRAGFDSTKELTSKELESLNIKYTSDVNEISEANFHIIAVPTPVNKAKQPDLSPLISASNLVGGVLKAGDIVVYESTVYPGATEEDCIPVLEKASGLKAGHDFKVGYSPERINPGDKKHTLESIVKVVSAQDRDSLKVLSEMYSKVVSAGVYEASSIKVAEAAKVIENSQRDINIAFVNELAIIFEKMGINTLDVLEAAGTKWNFLNFRPGLVGGHCIGVDPYYLTHKAEQLGLHPEIILSGRRINDSVGKFVAEKVVKQLIHAGVPIKNSLVTILGLTFKEDCPDLRNTRVVDIIDELRDYGVKIQVHDPECYVDEAFRLYKTPVVSKEQLSESNALIVAVAHSEYTKWQRLDIEKLAGNSGIILDLKGVWRNSTISTSFENYWNL
ncbi:nucleotide sugar dehydrogenase [Halobacteriovorax marinus]|nr:nucleotide sugar dehydrogenase [Halobacteriovorax marinus]